MYIITTLKKVLSKFSTGRPSPTPLRLFKIISVAWNLRRSASDKSRIVYCNEQAMLDCRTNQRCTSSSVRLAVWNSGYEKLLTLKSSKTFSTILGCVAGHLIKIFWCHGPTYRIIALLYCSNPLLLIFSFIILLAFLFRAVNLRFRGLLSFHLFTVDSCFHIRSQQPLSHPSFSQAYDNIQWIIHVQFCLLKPA